MHQSNGHPLPASPTIGEIRQLLDTMANGKANGEDRIPTEYLKYADSTVLFELKSLLESVWAKNSLPDSWKKISLLDGFAFQVQGTSCMRCGFLKL